MRATVFSIIVLAATLAGTSQAATNLPDFTELVKQYSPAVVNVSTTQRINTEPRLPGGPGSEEFDEFFRHFFPPDRRGSPFGNPRSLGSGFIISADGYVLTNNHVIDNAATIIVRLNDRRELEAKLIGADPRSDLALLKVDGKNLPTVKLGRSDGLQVGEWVLAIGSPFGFDYSVTAGIVSAMGRSLPTENNENYVPFIQTDVAINPGNSGGPLFNLRGEVVGINSQIYTRSGGFMGVSFAIPVDVAMEVVDQLKSAGHVSRGWLGVMIQEVNRDLAESFGLEKPSGALVARVLEKSPAAEAGLKEGDVILEFNGQPIDLSAELPHLVGRVHAGTKAKLTIIREGKRSIVDVVVGELADADDGTPVGFRSDMPDQEPSRVGLAVEALPDALAERAGIDHGVRVLRADGPAAEAGIQPGDVITRLNNQEIDSVEKFQSVVEALAPGRSVPVLIVRGQAPTFLALRVPED